MVNLLIKIIKYWISVVFMNKNSKIEIQEIEVATLGGGCFWCLEAFFNQIMGVLKVESGYAGGNFKNPTYELVCSGSTGHAEVVQITFNPKLISFRDILEIFFTLHDPTTLNRQGADFGTQYRSIILYHNKIQESIAKKIIAEINNSKVSDNPIVTTLEPFEVFYRAEDYHKNYYELHPESGYCRIVIDPKISKLRKKFSEKLKKSY